MMDRGGGGPVVKPLLSVVGVLLCLLQLGAGNYLRFEPGYEYQYKYHSNAQVHSVDHFTMEARVSYTRIRDVPEGQEIKVRVIALTMESGKARGVAGHNWDLSKWFSFVLTPRGEIRHVRHAVGEDSETLAIKKGLAALLAARLHHHSDQGEVVVIKTDKGWKYHVQENGHEGLHNATYDVVPSDKGAIFTKTRHNHPLSHATGSYTKTLHYHDDLGMLHTVEIEEHFDAMANPPEGYDPHIVGQPPPEEPEDDQPVLPSMTGEGRGKLEFLTKLHVTDAQSLVPPGDVVLATGSIHVGKVRKPTGPRVPLSVARPSIEGNLTCMRNQVEAEGSRDLQECFHQLQQVLSKLNDSDVTALVNDYFASDAGLRHYQKDRQHIVDAVWSIDTEHAQNEITRAVLRGRAPQPIYVERLLFLIGGMDELPSEYVVNTIITMTFDPAAQRPLFRKGDFRHRLVLVLGTLIRRLDSAGDHQRAAGLATKLQDMLGRHDPHRFREKRSLMSEAETIEQDLWKVVLLESLGNARLDQSYEHIVSHVNNTNSEWVKRAGVHALRDFHHEHAADVILNAALYDEHETVRYESIKEYRRHPYARFNYHPDQVFPNSSTYMDPLTLDDLALSSDLHSRRRRDVFKSYELLLQSPSVDWQKQLGSKKIGASFGLIIKNILDIKIGLLNSHTKVNIHDEVYGQVNLGFMGFNVDILRARLCFRGQAAYNLNLFQEFDASMIKRTTNLWDALKSRTVGAIAAGIKLFRDIVEGNISFADIIKAFGDSIKKLPDKVFDVVKRVREALLKISQYDDTKLPPFIIPLKNLVLKISNLVNDIQSDVMGFYNKLMTATVLIPMSGKQVYGSVEDVIEGFEHFQRDPKGAVTAVTGATLTIGIHVTAMVWAVKDVKEAAFFLKKEKPYWWDMTGQVGELHNLLEEVQKSIVQEGPEWVNSSLRGLKDEIGVFTKGAITMKQLRQKAIDELKALPEIVNTLLPLENMGDDMQQAFADLFDLTVQMRKAYDQLKNGTRAAKQFIERVFGPKAHKQFPRKTRTPGGGCEGKGFYPSRLNATTISEYVYDGVDLLMDSGFNVVAPFPGIIYLSGRRDEVVIESRGGSPRGVDFVITNIRANQTVKLKSDPYYNQQEVVAGQVIGEATRSPCGSSNHIHFAIRKGEGTVDPTRYIDPRFPEFPGWKQECDDYKYVYKGKTISAGSIAGLMGRKNNDTSPPRTPSPPIPAKMPPGKDPSSKLDEDIKKPNSLSLKVGDNKAQASQTANTSSDFSLKTLFNSVKTYLKKFNIKDMKLGSLVRLLHSLRFEDSLGNLTTVFRTVQSIVDNKPCLNLNTMPDADLRAALLKQGQPTNGSRAHLIKLLTKRSDKCPLLAFGLPDEFYCTMDDMCLGIECCLNVKVAFFRKSYKIFARFDPCEFSLVVGLSDSLRSFNFTFEPADGLLGINGGFSETVETKIKFDALDAEAYLKVVMDKQDNAGVLSLVLLVCQTGNPEDCITELPILDRAIMPLPICPQDGSVTTPSLDLKTLLKDQRDKFKQTAKRLLRDAVDTLVNEVFNAIPCLQSEDDADNLPCDRPNSMTEEVLTNALKSRGLNTSGTAQERVARLELDDRTCTVPVAGNTLTLPPIANSAVARKVYLKLAKNCRRVEACIDLSFFQPPITGPADTKPGFNYTRAVRAAITLDTCAPTFHMDFETCRHEVALFNSTIALTKEYVLSDKFTLKPSIQKGLSDSVYTVGLGMRIQLDPNIPAFIDAMFFSGFQIPVPLCTDFVLPGNGSLRAVAESMGNTLTNAAVRYFLKALKLNTVLVEGTCSAVSLSPKYCPLNIDYQSYLPASVRNDVTCVMTSNCLGLKCCLDVELDLPLMTRPLEYHLPFHMTFDPCDNLKVDLGFGTFTKVDELLNYEFGHTKVISIGTGQYAADPAPIEIRYTVHHERTMDPYQEHFLLDLNVRLCVPYDGQRFCVPDAEGIDVMRRQKVDVCTPAALTALTSFNLTEFLEGVQVPVGVTSLPRSVSQMLLNELGITSNLKATSCDQQRGIYQPSVDGWRNECPQSTQQLPDLPEGVVCHLSKECNRVQCCIYSSFLDMTFDAWFELNCDLYLQGGLERLVSPKHYVLGGEVNWDQGVNGSVDIAQVFKIDYLVRKDDQSFIVDANVTLCFDQVGGDCQMKVKVMQGTRIPRLGCNPGNVTYYDGLFNWNTCTLPKGDTGCHVSLPSFLKDSCVQTDNCQSLSCCFPLDLGFLGDYNLQADFRFDHCSNSFVFSMEKKTATLALSSILDVPQTEHIGSAITFNYQVKSTVNGYALVAGLKLCVLDPVTQAVTSTCYTYEIIPSDVAIYSPASLCSPGRRKKRAATSSQYSCESSPLSTNELMLYLIENENTNTADLEACLAAFKKKDTSKCDSLDNTQSSAAKVFTPKGMLSGLGTKNPSSLHFCNKKSLISVNLEGGNLIHDMLVKVSDIRGRLAQAFVPGAGLTNEGLKVLSSKLSNLTLGELQAYIMSEGADPELVMQLTKDMRNLLYSLYSDVMNKITDGGATDLFKSFDLSITGDFSVPRQNAKFFEISQFFLVGGIVPMTFEFSAGITSSVKVLVGAHIMQMKVTGQIVPYVGIRVQGSLTVGALLLGQLKLTGYICQVALPSTASIAFNKFPLDLNLAMDIQLKPLEIKLEALVTLEINLFFGTLTKVLFRAKLFGYESPTISKRVLDVGKNEPDTSPPKFDSYEQDTVSRKRRTLGTDRCYVRQIPGRDYTEPAIEIAVTASDDKSQPELRILAGTSPGLSDLLDAEMGGSSTIIAERLKESGRPVYFTVKATNNGGGSSEVTCSIDTYDITLPMGRLEAAFATTSNRYKLHGSVVVHEDSPLVYSDLAVGLGKGAYASGVRVWEPVNLMDQTVRPYNAGRDPHGDVALADHFTDFREGRLIVPSRLVTEKTSTNSAGECAKKCLAHPPSKCKSFNYHSTYKCELLEAIETVDHVVAVADKYLHYERLGAGLAHEFKLDMSMAHNTLYFINLYLENSLEFINLISSEGTLLDLTPPQAESINITSDVYEIIPCATNIPSDRYSDWIKWCRGQDMALPNHRTIIDGDNSFTVFNGHERMTDLLYTKANRYVSANWDGIHDYESGILGYTLTVGRQVCEEWLHPHHDPHSHLAPVDDDDVWTHIGVINTPNDISLPDGKYYATVRALNEVQYGGPLSTTFCHTTPYGIDTSPPIVYEVFGTKYDEETYVITTMFNASDPHSDILKVWVCLGRTILTCDLVPWGIANTSNLLEGPASLVSHIPDGVPAWVRMKVENGVELQAVGHASHPIIVDMSPPLAGNVYDGLVMKHDLAYSKDASQYCANWNNFSDPHSGIAYYKGAVLDESGAELTELTQLPRQEHRTCMPFDTPLLHNRTYRFLLYAFNAGHKQLNVSAESDGVLVDLTPPVTADVIDGLRPNFADVSYSVHKATVAAQWRDFHDPESGIVQYEVQVFRAPNLTSNFQVIQPWRSVELSRTFEDHHFHLRHRDVVKTKVKATNGALDTSTRETDDFIVDLTPPDMVSLWDGLGSADIEFTMDVTQLDASFEFIDEESGVHRYKYQVYQTQHGHRTQIVPATPNTWVDLPPGSQTSLSVTGLSLTMGLRYSLRVAAVNNAGAVATYDTNGVIVDPTPPAMMFVHVGVLSSEDEVQVNGYVLQSDSTGIKANWLGVDHESGIASYQVAVGTTPGGTDTLAWRDVGAEQDRYVEGLVLNLTNATTLTPLYYVSVRATNRAGDTSGVVTSTPVRVVQEDEAGIVTDGGADTIVMATMATSDNDYQLDRWSVTAQFQGFTSHLHGLTGFDWAVGTNPGDEDVLEFSALGIVHDESETSAPGNGIASRGMAQTVLPLKPDVTYYTTVRAFNNDGQAVQSTSDGFTVDTSTPHLSLVSLSTQLNASALQKDALVYQREPDALSAEWNFRDDTSEVVAVRYSAGTYPGADDVIPLSDWPVGTGAGSLPSTAVHLNTDGRPNIVTLWAENSVGLQTQVTSPPVVVDVSAPEAGVLTCPLYVKPHSEALCRWSGFHDPESPIVTFTFFVGSAPGLTDILAPVTLAGYVTSYPADLSSLAMNMKAYASVVATNALGLNATAPSDSIAMDLTPPVAGTVVELSDTYVVIAGDDSATRYANNFTCDTEEECRALDVVCQESLTTVLVAWSPFEDPETSVVKYEVAVGITPGGGQLRKLEEVAAGQRYHMVKGLNLLGLTKIYVTVKATNGAGLSTTATSTGVHLSYLSQGLSPPGHVAVWDHNSALEDLDYQTSVTTISASWTVEGDGCPAVRYQWAIHRVDGLLVSDFYDTNGATSGQKDGLTLNDLETYYQTVKVTNALGYTYSIRSDGITVHQDPLVPGEVFDGDHRGFDLNYLASSTKISANWKGFGDKTRITSLNDSTVDSVNMEMLSANKTGNQNVIRYLVAVGTDRRYDSTRDNIVPWTDVGLNTTVTISDLQLTPLTAIYYFSVRAYSASNSRAEITSNGFKVGFDDGVSGGRILVEDYVSSNTTMEVNWDRFHSKVGMFIYYVGLSSAPVDNSTCLEFTFSFDISEARPHQLFDLHDVVNTRDETYVTLQGLDLPQDSDVYISVIGVDRAGVCRMISKVVHVDVTAPVAGRVKSGPYYNQSLAFAPRATEIRADWELFQDLQSPIKAYQVELLEQPVCDVTVPPGGDVISSFTIDANYSSYNFLLSDINLSLSAGHPYYVRVTAINGASLRTSVTSAPVIFDPSTPVVGHVIDGTDFRHDVVWVGSNSTFKASVLHLATPHGPACPSRLLLFNGTVTLASGDRSQDSAGRGLDLVTQPAKAAILNDTAVQITLTRDTNKYRMYTATLLHHADFIDGGTYEMDIQAADGDGNAVTSVTLWDGDSDNVIPFDYTPPPLDDQFCMCCLITPPEAGCLPVCSGCTAYIEFYNNNTASTAGRRRRRRRSAGVVSGLSDQELQDLQGGMTLEQLHAARVIRRTPACGIQIYTLNATDLNYADGSRGRLVAWCTFGEDVTFEPKHVAQLLTFDPSAASHHYKMDVFAVNEETVSPTFCLAVFLDAATVPLVQLCGLPALSQTTRLALSVWNWKNFLTDANDTTTNTTTTTTTTTDSIALWQARATFNNVRLPASSSRPCRFGSPFRGGDNPVVSYEAGVGTALGLDDVVPFRKVYTPCFPCVHSCDSYTCDPACDPTVALPLTLTLDGLDLPSVANASSEVYEPTLYFFTVKAVLGSGVSAVASSDGFSIDVTPPVPDPSVFYYLDTAQGEAKPVISMMASNSTVQAIFRCADNESDIANYEWAIGTTPGGQDIQNYTSTGRNPTGKNDQLFGIITHNTKYYVSYRCTNGGGLSTTVQDPNGVTAFLDVLVVNDVSGDLQNTDPIGSNVVPATARKSSDSNSFAMTLTVSQDPSIDLYYFSLGSKSASSSKMADVFPRTPVAHNMSGVISIRDGNVYKSNVFMFSLHAARLGYNGTGVSAPAASDFQMEPGREMFAFVDSCNEATCSGLSLVGSVLVTNSRSYTAVSIAGEALTVGLTSAARGKRSARSRPSRDEERARVRRAAADEVFVETPSGLQAGQAVVVTQLNETDLSATYESVASVNFVSYLTNPTFTLSAVDTVDRILVGRASYTSATDVAFALASVGQLEMPGPVKVKFPYDPTDTTSTVQLLHWNPDQQKWQLSSETCENEADTEVKDSVTSTITVKVCNTRGGSGYFTEETLFLLPSVSNTIANNPPVLDSAASITMLEDEGTLVYEVLTSDPEQDDVTVTLDSPPLSPDQGTLTLTPADLLLYSPCGHCSGTVELRLILTEVSVAGITPITASATVTVDITPVNDVPTAFAFHKGAALLGPDSAADVLVLLEQNRVNLTTDTSYTWVFGAYDVDLSSSMTLVAEGPSLGVLTQGTNVSATPVCAGPVTVQDDTIPCYNMTLPKAAADLTWQYMTLTYRPSNGNYGYDTVRLLATDEGGLGSTVVTLRFAIMEQPCENNGTCVPKSPAYTCLDTRRAEWFDRYYVCNCSDGFVGLHCSGDINDCAGEPCAYPYVCEDLVNSYRCRCAADNPGCDGLEGWMIGVIVVSVLLVIIAVVVGLLIWAIRTGRIRWLAMEKKRSPEGESKLKIVDNGFDNEGFKDTEGVMKTKRPKMMTSIAPVLHSMGRRGSSSLSILTDRSSSASNPASQPSHSSSSKPQMNVPHYSHFQASQSPRRGSGGLDVISPTSLNEQVHMKSRASMQRSSSTTSIGSVNQSLGRPITPVEHHEAGKFDKW